MEAANLCSAVLSDALDALGYLNQCLSSDIRPLDDSLVLCGRARTGIYMETPYKIAENENPYELEMTLLDSLKPGEIIALACGNSEQIVPWGGILTIAAKGRGGAGCLTDGKIRDANFIREANLPVFHKGFAPMDSGPRARIKEIDVPVRIGGVLINPGDLVFGDIDGVLVIPRQIEDAVLKKAHDKTSLEKVAIKELQNGAYLKDVWERHKVL